MSGYDRGILPQGPIDLGESETPLNPLQQRVAKVQLGQFRTVWDAKEWVWGRWGVRYTYKGMYSLMKGLGLGLKVPRPHSDKADAKQQMAWKKGAYWMPWARLE